MAITFSDFRVDLRDALVEHLRGFGYDLDPASDADDALVTYLNVARRRLEPRPRIVHRSTVLAARRVPVDRLAAVEEVARRAVDGDDLNPFLHRALKTDPEYDDALLNDWGIHHLHLGSVDPDPTTGLTTRSKELLFVLAQGEALYMLDVRDHGSFEDEDLVQILHDEWPDVIAWCRLPFVRAGQRITAAERRAARRAGIQSFVELRDGTVYGPPGGGLATTRLSVRVRDDADRIWDGLAAHAKHFRTNSSAFEPYAPRGGALHLHYVPLFTGFRPAGFLLVDRSSGQRFAFRRDAAAA